VVLLGLDLTDAKRKGALALPFSAKITPKTNAIG